MLGPTILQKYPEGHALWWSVGSRHPLPLLERVADDGGVVGDACGDYHDSGDDVFWGAETNSL